MCKLAVKCHRDAVSMFPVLFQGVPNATVNFIYLCMNDPFAQRDTVRRLEGGLVVYRPSSGTKNHQRLTYIHEHQSSLKISLALFGDNCEHLGRTWSLGSAIMESDWRQARQISAQNGGSSFSDDDPDSSDDDSGNTSPGTLIRQVRQSGVTRRGRGGTRQSLGTRRSSTSGRPHSSVRKSARLAKQ